MDMDEKLERFTCPRFDRLGANGNGKFLSTAAWNP